MRLKNPISCAIFIHMKGFIKPLNISRSRVCLAVFAAFVLLSAMGLGSCNDPDTLTGKTLESIAVTTKPVKLDYALGETLNTADMIVTATYSDGSSEIITTGYTTTGFDSTTAGSKTIIVDYDGKKTTFTVTVHANPEPPPEPPPVPPPEPPPVGEIILHTKWPFKVGAAAPGSAFDSTNNGQHSLLKQFEVLVAENDMKPEALMPFSNPGNFNKNNQNLSSSYRWTNADKLVTYAEANGKAIRGHVLIWHSQTPNWFFQGSGVSGRATKAELYERMEAHIKIVFEKYRGRIGWWDVCNEVVDDNGSGPRTNSPYTQIMQDAGLTGTNRYEYVLKAFQWARQYADANGGQNVKLYLTDYNTEYSGGKQNAFEALVNWLITNNAPVDGIGFQGHIRYNTPSVTEISNAIDKFSAKTRGDGKKLMTQVCELDMSLFQWGGTEGSQTTLSSSVLTERLAAQTAKYRQLFDMFKEKNNAGKLDMVLVWGLADGESWLNYSPVFGRTDHPLLFDRNYQPKAAYNELVK